MNTGTCGFLITSEPAHISTPTHSSLSRVRDRRSRVLLANRLEFHLPSTLTHILSYVFQATDDVAIHKAGVFVQLLVWPRTSGIRAKFCLHGQIRLEARLMLPSKPSHGDHASSRALSRFITRSITAPNVHRTATTKFTFVPRKGTYASRIQRRN